MSAAKVIDLNQYELQGERQQRASISLQDAVKGFQDAMAAAGLGRPEIEADGRIHRFDLPEEKRGKKTGWYLLFHDELPAGTFGRWDDETTKQNWNAKGPAYSLTPEEQSLLDLRVKQAKEARDRARLEAHCTAAQKLYDLYSRLPEATVDACPYLQRKHVGVFGGVRALRDTLCVPMLDKEFRFSGMQFIAAKKPADGGSDKKIGKDVMAGGLFNVLHGDNSTVYLCEGYSTGASIHMATGNTVVLAFNAGNLMAVGRIIKDSGRFQGAKFVVAADDDRWNRPHLDGSPNNPGQDKAKEVCAKLGFSMVSPIFGDLSSHPTDFNDLHTLEGIEAVKLQITAKNIGPKLTDWDSSAAFTGDPPAREWLVRGVFPRGQVSLIAAAGGIGKSYLLLSLGRDVASTNLIRPAHFGGPIELTGRSVYLSAEDDHIEIHGRLNSLGGPIKGFYAVPLPSAGGAKPYFQAIEKQFVKTESWSALVAQLHTIKNLTTLIIDPIQPLCAMDLNMPEAAQAVCSFLADLAADMNIAVIVAHHFRKSTVTNAEDARNAIRGTAGLVDGVRSVYALWQAPEGDTKKSCKKLCIPIKEDTLVYGCVVKGNGQKLSGVRKFIRADHGALIDMTNELRDCVDDDTLLIALKEIIAEAAEDGKPYTKTGANGLYDRRAELPEPLCLMARGKLWELAETLMASGDVRTCSAKGSKTVKWLDVTDGSFAVGDGCFAPGFFSASEKSIE
jgi:phage/plasmid primase-like uncharacterized protein